MVEAGRCTVQVTKQMDKQMNHMRKRLVAVSIAGFMADTIDVESPFATSAAGQTAKPGLTTGKSALPLPAQPVDATQALNLSAGVSNCKVSRGRSFS